MKITSGIFAVLLLSHISVTNAVTLNRVETQMVKQVTNDEPKARALLKKVVNINSGSMNFAGVKKVGDIFAHELKQLGFNTKWIDGKAFNRSGHLFAERLGKADTQRKAPKILMIGEYRKNKRLFVSSPYSVICLFRHICHLFSFLSRRPNDI